MPDILFQYVRHTTSIRASYYCVPVDDGLHGRRRDVRLHAKSENRAYADLERLLIQLLVVVWIIYEHSLHRLRSRRLISSDVVTV